MKDYLITGGFGKLGAHIRDSISAFCPTKDEMNILNLAQMEQYIREHPAISILHLAAISDRKIAEIDKQRSYNTNVRGTAHIAQIAARLGKKMIYISTDYVFSGCRGNYKEQDPPKPINWYGFTKYAGELEVMQASSNYLIIRTSFRPSVWEYPTAYSNVHTSADYIDVIAKEIQLCLSFDLSGIIHIGTPKKTLYELAIRRNPHVVPEELPIPQYRDFSISKWERIKRDYEYNISL